MRLHEYMALFQPEIERELVDVLNECVAEPFQPLRGMLAYHMGWKGEKAGPEAQGKRIRPMLVLLSTLACSPDWRKALPAAAAVEYMHNFSLIHDDIQDQSPLRRGRPTVWMKWGMPQGINAGDLMFTISHLAMLKLSQKSGAEVTLNAARLLHETCVRLTEGQYLDIAYENALTMDLDRYWPMIEGKTAALLACSCKLGAIVGGAPLVQEEAFNEFGHKLGLAFQVRDDYLGIWGDSEATGKSTESDLTSGKKTLPVLFGLQKQGRFFRRWSEGPVMPDEVAAIADSLAEEGAKDFTQMMADRYTQEGIQALDRACADGDVKTAFRDLCAKLLQRDK
jgi:geranylgeranyl diphosphate synthase, type I